LISNSSFEHIRKKTEQVRNIELISLLQHLGSTNDRQDRAKWHTRQGVICVNGQKFINWNLGTGGGGAIDLVMHLQGINFKEAVAFLCEVFSCTPMQSVPPRNKFLNSPKKTIKNCNEPFVISEMSVVSPYSL